MDSNLDKIAKDLYGKIQTRFRDITMGDENANVLSKKEDIPKARFFEFEYTEGGVSLGTITITLDPQDGIVIQVSGDLVDDDNNLSGQGAYKFIRGFRQFAKDRLLNFDVQNIGKSNLDKRDYEFQAKRKEEPAMPAIMENKLYGNARMSYQDLGEARLIIKHSQPINPELPAGRTLHIESIYIENAQGERFRYPRIHLNGARALAEHIKHGGTPYDAIGKHITGLSEELASLRKFKGYVSRQEQLSEAMASVTNKVMERIEEVKKEINNLQRSAYYETFAESFVEAGEVIIPEELQNDLIDRLTVRTFNEELKSVFPYIYKFIDESELPIVELNADDLLDNEVDEDAGVDEFAGKSNETLAPEDEFESFLESIITEDKDELFSPNPQAQQSAVDKLNQIIAQDLEVGPDGNNGLLSVKGLIDRPDFVELVKASPAEMKLNDLIKGYLSSGHENILSKLDFEGTAAANPAQAEPAATAEPDGMPATEPTASAEPTPAQAELPAEPAPVAEGLRDPEDNPCWKGYKPVGTKKKNGKTVPNCVPKNESISNLINSAVSAGATLETQLDFGSKAMSLGEIIEACGMMPQEFGFEPKLVDGDGIQAMIKYIAGFYNKEESNFPLGGMRIKIKLKKAAEDGEFGDVSPEDVAKVIQFIDAKDPSGNEHNQIVRLAGVKKETQPDMGFDISTLETQLDSMTLQFNEAVLRSSDGKPVVDGSGRVVGTSSTTPQEFAAAQNEVGTPAPTSGASAPAPAPAPTRGSSAPAPAVAAQPQTLVPGSPTAAEVPAASTTAAAPTTAADFQRTDKDTTPVSTPAEPANRDSMTFGQAFADARKNGEKIFTWKGKKYTTELAKPQTQQQSGKPAPSTGSTLTPQQDAQIKALMAQRLAAYNKGDTATVANIDKAIQQWGASVNQKKPATESVGYSEDQSLASIVQLAGLR